MEGMIRKVIRASAGTGKTYRLSLEFINILIRCQSMNAGFEEILVITFTRKATSEIRSAVFKHLKELLSQSEKGIELQENLHSIYGTVIGEEELSYLKRIYEDMLVNKHKLQISTIDSFIHSVFKTVIAPYIGLTDFQINNDVNSKYLPDIYNYLFSEKSDSSTFLKIFRTAGKKSIENYDGFILSLIENRWLIHLIRERRENSGNRRVSLSENSKAEEYLSSFQKVSEDMISWLEEYISSSNHPPDETDKYFRKNYLSLVSFGGSGNFLRDFRHLIQQESFLTKNWKLLCKEFNFWDMRKIKDKSLKENLIQAAEEARQLFCFYIYHKFLLREEEEILTLAEHILEFYDRQKMRDKVFTYSDIAYYTFRYLYAEELSLIDPVNGSVSNRFYEYLSIRTRFILIDEFQDTGIIQYKLLYPIISEIISGYGSKEYGGVIVVGDEKQSIYGWRNGERELLINMPLILQSEDSVSLNKTYRSTAFITGFVNDLFSGLSEKLIENRLDWEYMGKVVSESQSQVGLLDFHFLNISKRIPGITEEQVPDQYSAFVENCLLPLYRSKRIDPAKSVILARDNRHLRGISQVLEDYGIDFFLESTFSFLHHQSIRPIIHLLRYLAEQNVVFLLRFLRSDICLLPPNELKEVALLYRASRRRKAMPGDRSAAAGKNIEIDNSFIALLKDHFPENRIIIKTVKLLEQFPETDLIELISLLIKEFNVPGLFPEEHNIKNLHLFLETVSHFFAQHSLDYPKNISGLMQFLEDNEKNEDFQQANIDSIDALQLMTIHKAKGLEFDNVFFFYEITPKGRSNDRKLGYLYQFNDLFTELKEFRVSYNYSDLLKLMAHPLWELHEKKDLLEEVNNIYVALTRAKANLSLFLTYDSKDGLIECSKGSLKEIKEDRLSIRKLFLQALLDYLKLDSESIEEAGEKDLQLINRKLGALSGTESNELRQSISQPVDISSLICFQRSKTMTETDEKFDPNLIYKSVYITKKQVLLGNITHYYISFIKYASEEELRYAAKRTLALYGNLMTLREIRGQITVIDRFIRDNEYLFSKRWSKVFTERTLFDKQNREQRIDRLLIDEEKKEILIVDFKTGSIKDERQLEYYKEIIAELPQVVENNYQINIEYIEVTG